MGLHVYEAAAVRFEQGCPAFQGQPELTIPRASKKDSYESSNTHSQTQFLRSADTDIGFGTLVRHLQRKQPLVLVALPDLPSMLSQTHPHLKLTVSSLWSFLPPPGLPATTQRQKRRATPLLLPASLPPFDVF